MSNAYVSLWTKVRCAWLRRVRDSRPLLVLFGGPHLSLPSMAARERGRYCVSRLGLYMGNSGSLHECRSAGSLPWLSTPASTYGLVRCQQDRWTMISLGCIPSLAIARHLAALIKLPSPRWEPNLISSGAMRPRSYHCSDSVPSQVGKSHSPVCKTGACRVA